MTDKAIVPEVGMGATLGAGSDCYPYTILAVLNNGKMIVVRANEAKCEDYYAGKWTVLDTLTGPELIYTLRKNGSWIKEGVGTKHGLRLHLGHRRRYENPSF